MKKLMLLIAAGSLWLFLAAVPVFADGGPHVAASNSGASTLTSDSCAGCHRAHTAKGEYLINQATEEALCLGCHGTAVTGATTSVMDGVQYSLTGGLRDDTTILGALRGGGFDNARIGAVGRLDTGTNYKTKVTVAAAGDPVSSAHIAMTENGLTNPHVAWGNGANNTGAGPSVTLSCVNCHNPHGNGQYRILNPVPAPVGVTNPVPVDIEVVDYAADVIYTKVGHPFQQGDLVTLVNAAGTTTADYVVWAAPNGITLQLQTIGVGAGLGMNAAAALDLVSLTTPAFAPVTIRRTSAPVADSPVGTPDSLTGIYPLKNYTVIQTKGTQAASYSGPAWGGYTFFASQITTGNTTGDYWHRQVPWDASSGSTQDGPNGMPGTVTLTGQVNFNQQITAWCSGCHSRYFANQNKNPGLEQGSSTFLDRTIDSAATTTITISTVNPAGGSALTSSGFNLGDVVDLAGMTPAVDNGYVVYVSAMTMRVSATLGGAPISFSASGGVAARVAPATASQWFFPRETSASVEDSIFTYQHSTRSNRTCNVCHVAHGSNADMTGTFSANYTRPDGVATSDSRLLKIDNRGTCQGCHDPTSTWATANATGAYQGATSGITGGSWSGATPPINTGGTPVTP